MTFTPKNKNTVLIGGRVTEGADVRRSVKSVRHVLKCGNCRKAKPDGNCPVCGRFAR